MKTIDNFERPKSMGFIENPSTNVVGESPTMPFRVPISSTKQIAKMNKNVKSPAKKVPSKIVPTLEKTMSDQKFASPELMKRQRGMVSLNIGKQSSPDLLATTSVRSTAPLFRKEIESPIIEEKGKQQKTFMSLDLGSLQKLGDKDEISIKRKAAPKMLDKEMIKKLEKLDFKLPGSIDLDKFKAKDTLPSGRKRSNSSGDSATPRSEFSPENELEQEKKKISSYWILKDQVVQDWSNINQKESINVPLVADNPNYLRECGANVSSSDKFEIYDKDLRIPYYQKYLKDKPHLNLMVNTEKEGAMVISLECKNKEESKKQKRVFLVLIRTANNHCERLLLVHSNPLKGIKEELAQRLGKAKFVEAEENIIPQLLKFEDSNIVTKYKFGILYVKEGQDENQAFSNTSSPDFDEFIESIGQRITLKGWEKYRGGLNVKDDITGKESIYTEFEGFEIMFHVSTMLPFHEDDPQKLERKRHLGNDVVLVIFKEGNTLSTLP